MKRFRAGGSLPAGRPKDARNWQNLDRRTWRNWYLFVGVAVVTTVGLAAAILTTLGDRVREIWPWAKTDLILLAGLAIAIVLFAGYLTMQQRRLSVLRIELMRSNEESAARMRRTYDRLVALLNVSRVLTTETNPQMVFDSITRTCSDAFTCRQASLMLLDEAMQILEVRSVCGADEDARELARPQKLGLGIAGWVAVARQPLVLNPPADLARYPGLRLDGSVRGSLMVAPIITRGDLVGVLSVSGSAPGSAFDGEDLQALLLFAESVGICCRHAEQTDWMRQTIQRLDAALQERRPDGGRRAA